MFYLKKVISMIIIIMLSACIIVCIVGCKEKDGDNVETYDFTTNYTSEYHRNKILSLTNDIYKHMIDEGKLLSYDVKMINNFDNEPEYFLVVLKRNKFYYTKRISSREELLSLNDYHYSYIFGRVEKEKYYFLEDNLNPYIQDSIKIDNNKEQIIEIPFIDTLGDNTVYDALYISSYINLDIYYGTSGFCVKTNDEIYRLYFSNDSQKNLKCTLGNIIEKDKYKGLLEQSITKKNQSISPSKYYEYKKIDKGVNEAYVDLNKLYDDYCYTYKPFKTNYTEEYHRNKLLEISKQIYKPFLSSGELQDIKVYTVYNYFDEPMYFLIELVEFSYIDDNDEYTKNNVYQNAYILGFIEDDKYYYDLGVYDKERNGSYVYEYEEDGYKIKAQIPWFKNSSLSMLLSPEKSKIENLLSKKLYYTEYSLVFYKEDNVWNRLYYKKDNKIGVQQYENPQNNGLYEYNLCTSKMPYEQVVLSKESK